ncbi:MAG TPA: ribonuclease III domain-containing protein [Candidatus Baltobacteraceae bacterium]|nr:ribonuclease III domain-containing protein [Candidatus Baltobacteraceae bacterium]
MDDRPDGAPRPVSEAGGGDIDRAVLQTALDYQFRRSDLLELALSICRPPLTPETAAARQRLEFLGDAAWNFAIAGVAYREHPHADPGALTRLRAAWSSRTGLATLARRLGLALPPAHFPHGPSHRVTAELVEAVFGALVEDGGFDALAALAKRVVAETDRGRAAADPKSALQILSLARHGKLPVYRMLERRGPAHHPTFRVSVALADPTGDIITEGEGASRQAAEQEAARTALAHLENMPGIHNIL